VSAENREDGQPPFSAGLTRWRERRGLSKKNLAAAMGFSASYLSHIEAGRMNASEQFARKAEEALDAGGELAAAWRRDNGSASGTGMPFPGGLVVEDDHAELSYDGAFFRASQRRLLRNDGPPPPRPSRYAPCPHVPSAVPRPYSPGQPATRQSAPATGSNGTSAGGPTTPGSILNCAPRQTA